MVLGLWELFCRWFSLAPRLPSHSHSTSPQSRGCPVQPVDLCASIRDVLLSACPLARRHMCTTAPFTYVNPSTFVAQMERSFFCFFLPRPGLQAPDSASDEHAGKRPCRVRTAKNAVRDDKARSTLCRGTRRCGSVVVLMLGRRGGCYGRRAPFPAGQAVGMEKLRCPRLEGFHLLERAAGVINCADSDFETHCISI